MSASSGSIKSIISTARDIILILCAGYCLFLIYNFITIQNFNTRQYEYYRGIEDLPFRIKIPKNKKFKKRTYNIHSRFEWVNSLLERRKSIVVILKKIPSVIEHVKQCRKYRPRHWTSFTDPKVKVEFDPRLFVGDSKLARSIIETVRRNKEIY